MADLATWPPVKGAWKETKAWPMRAVKRECAMSKDRIYGVPQNPVPPFRFDESVVRVFDDMLTRSIPLYREIIRRQVQLLVRFYQEGTRIYDLGCSNGNLGMGTCRTMGNKPFEMIAVDSSRPMIEAYAARLEGTPHMRRVTLEWGDIRQTNIDQASVVVLNFTLQFIAPEHRDTMVTNIYDGLLPNGVLLLCEKSAHANATIENIAASHVLSV